MKQIAFTLIELLVVVAVVVVLAAILLPVMASARQRAQGSVCLSNLRQIGSAIEMYGADYDLHIPYAVDSEEKAVIASGAAIYGNPTDQLIGTLPDVPTAIAPYGAARPIFHCPVDRFLPVNNQPHTAPSWFEQYGSSYQYRTIDALEGLSLSLNGAPSGDILMSDYAPFHGGDGGYSSWVNVLYADGHVKTITWEDRSNALDTPPQ